jgi:hypothetical protein
MDDFNDSARIAAYWAHRRGECGGPCPYCVESDGPECAEDDDTEDE